MAREPWAAYNGGRVKTIDEDADLPDFSSTIAGDLEDTVRNLRVLREEPKRRSAEYSNFEMQAIQNLTDELRAVRGQVATLTTTVNTKAGKGYAKLLGETLTKHIDKRLDTIRNWAAVALTVIAIGLAIKVR